MEEFIYMFGYENPSESQLNRLNNTDFESSRCILIVASSEEEALAWGRQISEEFIKHLFKDTNKSWLSENYAHYIEKEPDENLKNEVASFPKVNVGEFPDYESLL